MNPNREFAPLICLIGYRGTGKTTVAQRLSERIGWQWIDADAELERNAGQSIREIFQRHGEKAFRDLETETVLDLTLRERLVIAWGGGAILREQNFRAIRRGLVVWLQADPATIWERVNSDPTNSDRRPNLTTGGLKEIEDLLTVRTPLYRDCADYSVPTAGRTPDQIAEEIVCLLRAHFPDLNQT